MELNRRGFLQSMGAIAAGLILPPTVLPKGGASAPSMPAAAPMSIEKITQAIKFLSELKANLFAPSLPLAKLASQLTNKSVAVDQIVLLAEEKYTSSLVWLSRYCGEGEAGLLAQTLNDCFSGDLAGSFFDSLDDGKVGFGTKIKALSQFKGRNAIDLLEHFVGSKDDFIRAQVLRVLKPKTSIERKELLQETNRILVDKIMLPASCTWKRYR